MTPRGYSSAIRGAQVEQTRALLIERARALLVEGGRMRSQAPEAGAGAGVSSRPSIVTFRR